MDDEALSERLSYTLSQVCRIKGSEKRNYMVAVRLVLLFLKICREEDEELWGKNG